MENPSSHVSLADVHHNVIGGAAGLDEMVLIALFMKPVEVIVHERCRTGRRGWR
jgi:hypothetical protein